MSALKRVLRAGEIARRVANWWVILGLMIAAAGTCTFGVIDLVRASESARIQSGGHAPARVVGVTDVLKGGFTVHATYTVDGRQFTESFDVYTSAIAPPVVIVVAYDPVDPSRAELPGQPKFSYGSGIGFIAVAIAFLLAVLWLSDMFSLVWRRVST